MRNLIRITMHKRITVMGNGMVGGALSRFFADSGVRAAIYDPFKGFDDASVLADADVLFVCVPTPYHLDGEGFDESFLVAALDAIPGEGKAVVIKSTVLPGTTEAFQARYPRHRLLFSPEFLTEATADRDTREPKRQIVGYTSRSRGVAREVLALLPRAPYERVMPAAEAEAVKYFCNAFYALKVAYCNQFFELCESIGVDYGAVRDGAAAEPMVGASHLDVHHKDYRGYGGKCLPKDVRSLLQLAQRNDVDLSLLDAAEEYNNRLVDSQKLDIRWTEGSPRLAQAR